MVCRSLRGRGSKPSLNDRRGDDVALTGDRGSHQQGCKNSTYPLPPFVLALVLGDMAESSFRQSMLLSQGGLSIFWSNGHVATIMGLGMILLLWPVVSWIMDKARAAKPV